MLKACHGPRERTSKIRSLCHRNGNGNGGVLRKLNDCAPHIGIQTGCDDLSKRFKDRLHQLCCGSWLHARHDNLRRRLSEQPSDKSLSPFDGGLKPLDCQRTLRFTKAGSCKREMCARTRLDLLDDATLRSDYPAGVGIGDAYA
jgi:hypothetical protein